MKSKKHGYYNNRIKICQHKLNLENEYSASYFLLTELEDGVPKSTYYYKIPDSFKDNRLLGELHERYAKYCPN
jgi:hypothetical protein